MIQSLPDVPPGHPDSRHRADCPWPATVLGNFGGDAPMISLGVTPDPSTGEQVRVVWKLAAERRWCCDEHGPMSAPECWCAFSAAMHVAEHLLGLRGEVAR